MKTFTGDELVIIGLSAIGIGIVMTPIFGAWIWVALLLSAWYTWLCVIEVETRLGS